MNKGRYWIGFLIAYVTMLPVAILKALLLEPVMMWREMRLDMQVLQLRDELKSKKIAIGIAATTFGKADKLEVN